MAVIDVEPTIYKGVVVVSGLGRRGGTWLTTGSAIGDVFPGFVWTNEMNGLDLGAVTFISRGVAR